MSNPTGGVSGDKISGSQNCIVVSYPDRIRLSHEAEIYLDRLGLDLHAGTVGLEQLPPSLSQWYWLAFYDGAVSRQPELERLSTENDRLYLRAFNTPAQVEQITRRRMDGHFEREAARFFAEAGS